VLAARYPAAKPVLVRGCALLGCRIELPAQIDNLAIETGELTTLGGDTYSLTPCCATRAASPRPGPASS
jgi:hypothetical protein